MRRYLRRLKGVDSVEVHARFCGDAGIRWTIRVGLENEPPVNTLIAIVGDSFNKVEEISGSSTSAVDMEIAWMRGSTSVRWSRKVGDATEAVKAVTGLCTPAIESIEVSSYGTSVRYRGVESFPDSWMVAPGSDVLSIDLLPFKQYVRVGEVGVTARYTRCADLGSVPLKQVFEAISPIYRSREGVSIKLDEMDFVSCQLQLRVAAFGSYEDGLDSDAAAKVLAVVLGNRVLQGIELSTAWERAGSDHVRFDMKNGSVVGEGWPPKMGCNDPRGGAAGCLLLVMKAEDRPCDGKLPRSVGAQLQPIPGPVGDPGANRGGHHRNRQQRRADLRPARGPHDRDGPRDVGAEPEAGGQVGDDQDRQREPDPCQIAAPAGRRPHDRQDTRAEQDGDERQHREAAGRPCRP